MIIVGIDWSKSKHDIVVMDPEGYVLDARVVAHSASGLDALAQAIGRHESDPTNVRVAVELHDGALVAWLVSQGYTVYGLNPKSAQRARDRYRPAGGKDDRSDAFIVADTLRLDRGTLRSLHPWDESAAELRSLGELRAARVQERVAVVLRLRGLLGEWCPELSSLCNDFDIAWQLDFLRRFPLLEDLAAAHGHSVNAFIRQHRMRRATADRIHTLRTQSDLPIPPGRKAALRMDITFLVRQIEMITEAMRSLELELSSRLERHRDAEILESLPVSGPVITSALLSGFAHCATAESNHAGLAARWGVAPITVASGRSRCVKRRRACDGYMRDLLMFFAFNTALRTDCWAHDYYRRKRAEGATHYGALRCLAQRWIKIITRMWHDREPYDEQRHRDRLVAQSATLSTT